MTTNRTFAFTIPGPAISKGRPRLGKGGAVYTPPRTRAYERTVGLLGLAARPPRWPLGARYAVRMTLATAFDLDNACKSILDGLNSVTWDDDRQVDYIEARRGTLTRVEIAIIMEEEKR